MAGVVEGLAPMERRLPPLGCLKGGRGEWVRRWVGWLSSSIFLVDFPVLKRPPPELLFYYIRILWYVFLHGLSSFWVLSGSRFRLCSFIFWFYAF